MLRARRDASCIRRVVVVGWLVVPCWATARGYSAPLERCPYTVLGIDRDASLAQVRSAYRSRARDWHPDKHPGDVDSASARFLEVAAAFELLSNEEERRNYDATGEKTSRQYREQQQRHQEQQRRQWRRRLTEGHRRAMARVIVVKSRKHLEDIVLGENHRVDRHLVLALFDPGQCEEWLTYSTMFPYPFADKLDDYGIWWEDVLQTAKARLTEDDGVTPSRIARRFGLNEDHCPSIVFARNGSSLWEDFDILRKPDAARFEAWIWPKLATQVHFVNDHTHTVRVYWIRGTQTYDRFDIAPGASETRTAYISHLFAARDIRAGGPLTAESVLTWQHIDSDANPYVYHIQSKCVDWNGDCSPWADKGECKHNPLFMLKFCAVSCAKLRATEAKSQAAQAAADAQRGRAEALEARRQADEALRLAEVAEARADRIESDAVAAEIVAEAHAAAARSVLAVIAWLVKFARTFPQVVPSCLP